MKRLFNICSYGLACLAGWTFMFALQANGQTCPPNIDFEAGNTSNWQFFTGYCCPINTPTNSGAVFNRHTITSGTGLDFYGSFPIVAPGGGSYSLKLGNSSSGAEAERARYYVHVPSGTGNYSLIYRYAVVFQNPGHQAADQPRFEVRAYDSATGLNVSCAQFTYVSASSLPGFQLSPYGSQVYYKSWSTASLNLSGQGGKTIAVDFASGDCDLGGHFGYGYIDLTCSLFQIVSVNCNGSPITTLSAPPGFQYYYWYNASYTFMGSGQTINIATPPATTQYHVVLTPYAGYGCPDTLTTTVSVSSLNLAVTNDTFSCGATPITLSAMATGSASSYTYSWTPAAGLSCTNCANPVANPAVSTKYRVTVQDNNGCSKTDSTQLTVGPFAHALTSDALCFGSADGRAVVSYTEGSPPYSVAWNSTPAQNSDTAFNLPAGTYTALVTDGHGCTDTAVAIVGQPAALAISVSGTPALCFGAGNGTATVSAAGGTTPYSFLWNTAPAQQTASVSGLSSGTYTVVTTDFQGCADTSSVVISEPPILDVAIDTQINVSCYGYNNGSATAVVQGGTQPYAFTWTTAPVQQSAVATALAAGSYILTVVDSNGCSDTAMAMITEPSALSLSIFSENVRCFGDSTGVAVVTPSGGTAPYVYQWAVSPQQNTDTAKLLPAGSYGVVVTDQNGCAANATATVAQPVSPLSAAIIAQHDAPCNGGVGDATVSATGGTPPYQFLWSGNPAQNTATASQLTAGGYSVQITDSNACTASLLVTISEPPVLTLSVNHTNVNCFGEATGTATVQVSGGKPPYNIQWSNAQNTSSLSQLTAGVYYVVVSDSNGCSATDSVVITQPLAPLSSTKSQTDVLCFGGFGSAAVAVSGGTAPYSYVWNTAPVQNTASAGNLFAGSYQVTVTDDLGCTLTDTFSISQPQQALQATIVSTVDVTCHGGTDGAVTGSALGGTAPYGFAWNTSPAQSTASINTLGAGNYQMIVTDDHGCTDTATAIVSEPPVLSMQSGVVDVLCFGQNTGSASTVVTGGTAPYVFLWSTSQTTASLSAVTAGSYWVQATDAHGCTVSDTITIMQPTTPVSAVVSTTPINCFGGLGTATAAGTGGTAPYSYSWNTVPAQSSATATGLAAGVYTVVVTDDNNCSFTDTVGVTQPTASLAATISLVTPVSCNGSSNASAQANVTGGTAPYVYSWNTSPVQTTAIAANLNAGNYTVSITDTNGCVTTASIQVTQPPALQTNITGTNNNCFGNATGTASIAVTGGLAPYNFTWNTVPVQNGAALSNLAAGTYICMVTDQNGCSKADSIVILQPSALLATVTNIQPVHCVGNADGSAAVSASGGMPPYTYFWSTSPPQSGPAANQLPPGKVSVTVTDNNGCTVADSAYIADAVPLLSTISNVVNPLCFGAQTGSVTVNISGGKPPYSYNWSTAPPQFGATATALAAGAYQVSITDSNGCVQVDSVTLTEPPALQISTGSSGTCAGAQNGIAYCNASGGVAPYSFLWSNNGTSDTIVQLTAGQYSVAATDAHGCIATATVNVLNYTSPVVNAGNDLEACAGRTVQLQAVGANSFFWYPSYGLSCTSCSNPLATITKDTTYYVVGTNAENCSDTDDVHLVFIGRVPTDVGPDIGICEGEDTSLLATGGTAYLWSPAETLSDRFAANPVARPETTTRYQVVITENNCFKDTLYQTVNVFPLPSVYLGQDTTVLSGTTWTLMPQISNATTIAWSPAESLSCTDCTNPVFTALNNVRIVATVQNDLGCMAGDDMNVRVMCDNSVLFMPNTFTPNGDGNNDVYYPIGRGISIVRQFVIFNRWGQKVFEASDIPANDPHYGWDGTFQGKQLPSDVFVYFVDALCSNGDPVSVKGDVSLLK